MTNDTIKAKIAKLMALAQNEGAADNEAETALRMAENLMRRHGISIAEVSAASNQPIIWHWAKDMCPCSWPKPVRTLPLWFSWIGAGIGLFTDTKVSLIRTHEKGWCVIFEGEETDVEYAMWLCAHIRDQIRAKAAAYPAPGTTSDERWANREEFRHAMARKINQRMRKLREERTEAYRSSGTALVVVDTKLKERDLHFGAQVYSDRKHSHIRGSSSAMSAGYDAGATVGLARPVGPQQRRLT